MDAPSVRAYLSGDPVDVDGITCTFDPARAAKVWGEGLGFKGRRGGKVDGPARPGAADGPTRTYHGWAAVAHQYRAEIAADIWARSGAERPGADVALADAPGVGGDGAPVSFRLIGLDGRTEGTGPFPDRRAETPDRGTVPFFVPTVEPLATSATFAVTVEPLDAETVGNIEEAAHRYETFCTSGTGRYRIKTPADVASLLRPYFERQTREAFLVLALDTANNVRGVVEHTTGGLAVSIVEPRGVFQSLLALNAASFIAVHNHPSGNREPSRSDVAISKQLRDAGNIMGITCHDSVIVAGPGYTSLAERGLL